MTPQELKNSILQLAIQGKIVEQRAEEGTAAESLEKIFAAKNAKGAKKNLTRRRRDAEATKESRLASNASRPVEDAPFDIPESWEWVRLESIINSVPTKQYQILESEVCSSGRFAVISQSKEYSIGFTDKSDKVYRHANPVIVFGDHTAEVKYVEFNFVVGADGVKVFEPKDSLITAKLLFYILQHYSCDLSKVGGYSRHYKFLKNKLIPLPPLAEQKRIVAKIEELLPLIDRYEKAWSKLEDFNKRFPVDMQKSLLQMAIQGKLVEQRPEEGTGEELYRQIQVEKQRLIKSGKIKKEKPLPEITKDEIHFEIPEGWKWVRLANIWSVLNGDRGKNYPAKSTLSHKGIPFISAINLVGKSVVKDDNLLCLSDVQYERLGNGKLVRGDVVVCIRGSLGKHGRYPFEKGAIASSLVIMRSRLELSVLDDFLMLYLDTPLFFGEIKRYDNGTAQPNLAAKSLEQFLFPLSPLAEQKRIVAKLEELLPLCERLK